MPKKYLLALDMGSSSLKCLIADLEGKTYALNRQQVTYYCPEGLAPLGREFSPATIWADVCSLIRSCLAEAGIEGKDIAAVSATSQRGGMVLLDEEGRELYAGPNLDTRAFFEGMALDEALGEDLYFSTGHMPSFLFAAAKLSWFRTHAPETFDKVHKILPISGWLTYKLSGQCRSEKSALGEIGLLNIRTGDYASSVLGGSEIDPEVVPALGYAGEVVGGVTSSASAATGLPKGTPVVLGGPDTQCGLLGMGVVEEGQMGVLAGWSAPLQLVTSNAIFDSERRTWTGCHVVPDRWVLESSTTSGGQALQWLSDILGAEYKETFAEEPDISEGATYMGQDQTVAFLGPRIMNCTKLGLQLGGILFPVPVGHTGISRTHLLQGALENLAFAIKGNYLQLQGISGLELSGVWLGGGVANIPAFPRLVADTLGVSVRVPQMKDSSLLGTAMCAAVGAGVYDNLFDAAGAMKGPAVRVEPDEPRSSNMEERYQRWLSLYQELEGLSGGM